MRIRTGKTFQVTPSVCATGKGEQEADNCTTGDEVLVYIEDGGHGKMKLFNYSDALVMFSHFIGYDPQQPEGLAEWSFMQLASIHA